MSRTPPQHRYAATQGGGALWVPVTDDDRKRIIESIPTSSSKWRDAIMLQESGEYDGDEGLYRLYSKLSIRCEFEDFKRGLSICRQWVETELQNLALDRAGGPHLTQPNMDRETVALVERIMREQEEAASA